MKTGNHEKALQEIGGQLLRAGSVLLFPHINMDGDTLGSAVALCRGLRNEGKKAWILIEDEIPEYLRFMDRGYCTGNPEEIPEPDICMCIDCGETDRFPERTEQFLRGRTTICLDHHTTSEPFADYNYIDSSRAATSELTFELLQQMGLEIDREMGEALYVGISTDTGNFQYSNTTKETHLIAAQLYDTGIDAAGIAVKLYQNVHLETLRLKNRILDTMELFCGGKAIIAYVTRQMLKETGTVLEDAEGSVDILRNIYGVEIAVFAKEKERDVIKVSMRAKTTGNVAQIAEKFQGGGHVKAAGCTIHAPLETALEQLKEETKRSLKQ